MLLFISVNYLRFAYNYVLTNSCFIGFPLQAGHLALERVFVVFIINLLRCSIVWIGFLSTGGGADLARTFRGVLMNTRLRKLKASIKIFSHFNFNLMNCKILVFFYFGRGARQ